MQDESSLSTKFLPLEGCISAIWKCFGSPSHDRKFVEPDRKQQIPVHCKVCTKVQVLYIVNILQLSILIVILPLSLSRNSL